MHRSQLIAKLPKGSTFFATWLEPIEGNRPRVTKRRVVSQSSHVMKSEILDGPQKGVVIRLDWANVVASEEFGVITLSAGNADFIKIDTIEECTDGQN